LKQGCLGKPIEFKDNFLQGVCHDPTTKKEKKCCEVNAFFTVDWQQYKAALVKIIF